LSLESAKERKKMRRTNEKKRKRKKNEKKARETLVMISVRT
jgi:hypothetical protein